MFVKWTHSADSYPRACFITKAIELLVTVTGWYHTKRVMQLRPFYDLLCDPIWVLINPDASIIVCGKYQQRHLVAKQARNGGEFFRRRISIYWTNFDKVQSCLIPEDNSEHHTRRRENLKSHITSIKFVLDCLHWNMWSEFSIYWCGVNVTPYFTWNEKNIIVGI
jgi:hypothetical protein